MRGWTVSVRNPISRGDLAEDLVGLSPTQGPSGDRHEEPIDRSASGRADPASWRRRARAAVTDGCKRDQAYPVELGVSDGDHALGEVDVGAGQRHRLPAPHAGRCQQPEQRPVGGGPQRWL